MLSLQTEFALHTWQTGIKRTTTAAHGQFSKLNCGDGVRPDPANPREKVEIFPASSLYARAKGMSPDHWNQLMDDAVVALNKRHQSVKKSRAAPMTPVRRNRSPHFVSSD